MVTNDSQIWKKGGSFDIQDCGYKGVTSHMKWGGTNCWVSGQGITPLECAPQPNLPTLPTAQWPFYDRHSKYVYGLVAFWMAQFDHASDAPISVCLSVIFGSACSGYHYPHFQRAWFWSDPIGPVIVCDLRPSVITYDMVCPHLTPYKAIHSIDSQLLHHHTIKELQKILLRACAQGIRLFWILIVPYKSLFSF